MKTWKFFINSLPSPITRTNCYVWNESSLMSTVEIGKSSNPQRVTHLCNRVYPLPVGHFQLWLIVYCWGNINLNNLCVLKVNGTIQQHNLVIQNTCYAQNTFITITLFKFLSKLNTISEIFSQ